VPDLTFADVNNLSTKAYFVVINNRLYCDVGSVIDESVNSPILTRLTEFAYRLMLLGFSAQSKYNVTPATKPTGERIGSYTPPSYGSTASDASGNIYATSTVSLKVRLAVQAGVVLSVFN
jgi:hypothetical protein